MKNRTLAAALLLPWTLGLASCAGEFFFHPDPHVYTTPQRAGVEASEIWFTAVDGKRLNGWWLPAQDGRAGPARGTVVHAHGNAANISNHLPQVAWLAKAGFNVLMFDYRGFGLSDGKPTLDGVVADTRSAVTAALRQPGVDPQRLVVLGQSLGGATAIRALAQGSLGVRLLIVDSAFDSYRGIARDAASGPLLASVAALPILTLPGAHSDPRQAIGKLTMPVVILHGDQDETIPIEHGWRLYNAANEPRLFIPVRQGRHIHGLLRPDIRERLLARIDEVLGPPPEQARTAPPPDLPVATAR